MQYTHDDFYYSAKQAVDEHFKSFPFPGRELFNEDEVDHIYHVASSILMTRHKFQQGGGFVQAVVGNDLHQAFNRADSTMVKALRIMNYVNYYGEVFKADPKFVKAD